MWLGKNKKKKKNLKCQRYFNLSSPGLLFSPHNFLKIPITRTFYVNQFLVSDCFRVEKFLLFLTYLFILLNLHIYIYRLQARS